MAVSAKTLQQAQKIGAKGGFVKTTNLPSSDANKINAAVNKGRQG